MSDRPDLDEFARIVSDGGFKITGGKYAPQPTTPLVAKELKDKYASVIVDFNDPKFHGSALSFELPTDKPLDDVWLVDLTRLDKFLSLELQKQLKRIIKDIEDCGRPFTPLVDALDTVDLEGSSDNTINQRMVLEYLVSLSQSPVEVEE